MEEGTQSTNLKSQTSISCSEPNLEGQESCSELRLQMMDQRDAFLFEYEELENEVLELREIIGGLQSSLEEANQRWAQERNLKLQLERQLLEFNEGDFDVRQTKELIQNFAVGGENRDSDTDTLQPCTPPGIELSNGKGHCSSPSACSLLEAESPRCGDRDQQDGQIESGEQQMDTEEAAESAKDLNAQTALANLQEENRLIIEELIKAKLEIAIIRGGQEIPQKGFDILDKGHLENLPRSDSIAPSSKSQRRLFSRKS